MNPTPAEIAGLLEALAETPRILAASTAELDPTLLQHKPGIDSWSLNDILAHLRACADIWGKGITAMLTQEQPTLRYISPRTWIRKTDYPDQEFCTSLQAFTQQRAELLSSLTSLAIEDWSRAATVKASGKQRIRTVFDYAQQLKNHEEQHIVQFELTALAVQITST